MKRFLFATLLCAIGHHAFGADTDGDGLLDVIDVPGFNANASGDVFFDLRGIQDLDGANLLANATSLFLWHNRITSLESGDFEGLSNLQTLMLWGNQIASIDNEAFQGLSNLETLHLGSNQITRLENGAFSGLNSLPTLILDGNSIMEMNLTRATFDSLSACTRSLTISGFCADPSEITDLILDEAVLSLGSFEAIVGGTTGISNVSLVGLRFSDMSPDDLSNLLTLERLDSVRVDQALFDRYAAEFNVFDAILGNTVTVVPEPTAIFLCAAWILSWSFRQRRHAGHASTHGESSFPAAPGPVCVGLATISTIEE